MIGDVLFAVAVIAVAFGAVPELQIGIGKIGSAADSTAMGVGGFGLRGGSLIGTCVERNGLMLLIGSCVSGPFCGSSGVDPPGLGQNIQHIAAKEQEVIGQGNDAEEIVGEGGSKKVAQQWQD